MKTFLLLFVIVASALAADAPKFIVHWQAEEPDPSATAITCTAGFPSKCASPTKLADHYSPFATEGEALDFASEVSSTVEPKPKFKDFAKFIAIYSIKPLSTKLTEVTVTIPQAAPPLRIIHQAKVEKR